MMMTSSMTSQTGLKIFLHIHVEESLAPGASCKGKVSSINVTRMWNMISSPATPTVCLEQKSENFQSLKMTLSMPSQSQK